MRSVIVHILLTFVLQACAKEISLSPTSNVQNAKFLDRKLSAGPIENSGLDDTLLGKSGSLATRPMSQAVPQAKPLIPQRLSYTRPDISYNPPSHNTLSFSHPVVHRPVQVQAGLDLRNRLSEYTIKPKPGANKKKKRIARGNAGKGGGTGGRGNRGQNSRSGGGVRPGFEGGQTPLYRRLPKLKGDGGNKGRSIYVKRFGLNLGKVQEWIDKGQLDAEEPITADILKMKRLVTGVDEIKLLGRGELNTKVDVKLQGISAEAKVALDEQGSTYERVPFWRWDVREGKWDWRRSRWPKGAAPKPQ